MARPTTTLRWFLSALLVLLPAGALLALLAWPAARPRHFLAQRWRHQLQDVPDEQVRSALERIARLEEDGLPILVEALGSRREVVSETAAEVLVTQVDRWQMLPARRSSPRVAALARLLSGQVEQFPASSRRVAADLATHVLLWPIDRQSVDNGRLILDCEKVLLAASGSPSGSTASGQARWSNHAVAPDSPGDGGPASAALSATPPASERPSPDELPRGDLPAEMFAIQALAPRLADVRAEPNRASREPQLFVPPVEVLDLAPAAESSGRIEPWDNEDPPDGRRPVLDPAAQLQQELRRLDDLELMRQLRAGDAQRLQAAQTELRRRGFQSAHLPLAQRLVHPDPAVRQQLAEMLPQSPVDARPWLLWLSRDDEPAVRMTAVTIMATSRDPQLLHRLRQLELEETDPQILRQVQRTFQGGSRR